MQALSTKRKNCVFCFLETAKEEPKSDVDNRVVVLQDQALIKSLWKLFPYVFRATEKIKSALLHEVCKDRGWREFQESSRKTEENSFRELNCWNFNWRNRGLNKSLHEELRGWQTTNHIPDAALFCKKDILARCHRRMKKTYPLLFNFCPESYNIPPDYNKIVAEHGKRREVIDTEFDGQRPTGAVSVNNNWYLPKGKKAPLWIGKPVGKSQGKGIVIFDNPNEFIYDVPYVVQEYIARPYLIDGYKWDLRLYVCITCTRPLTVYAYREGIARFATKRYQLDDLKDLYSHLTNTSLNKLSPTYSKNKDTIGYGSKWTLKRLRKYLKKTQVNDFFMWQRIWSILVLTIIGDAREISLIDSKNAFEFLGFDILIDEYLKPHLLEVNVSPGLGSDSFTSVDEEVKKPMLDEMFNLIGLPDGRHFESEPQGVVCCENHIPLLEEYKLSDQMIEPCTEGEMISSDDFIIKCHQSSHPKRDGNFQPEIKSIEDGPQTPIDAQPSSQRKLRRSSRINSSPVHLDSMFSNPGPHHPVVDELFEFSQVNVGPKKLRRIKKRGEPSFREGANSDYWAENRANQPQIDTRDVNNNTIPNNCNECTYRRVVKNKHAPKEQIQQINKVEPSVKVRLPLLIKGSRERAKNQAPVNGPGLSFCPRIWEEDAPKSSGKWVKIFPFNQITQDRSRFKMEDDGRRSVLQVSDYLKKAKEIMKRVEMDLENVNKIPKDKDYEIAIAQLLNTDVWYPKF